MDYKLFYLAIRRYLNRRISRVDFMRDWAYAQSRLTEVAAT